MNQMADAAVLQSVHCIYIFIYRPYCLKRKTKIQDNSLFRSSEPFYGCTHYKTKRNKQKKSVFTDSCNLQLIANALKIPQTLLLSVSAWTLYSILHRLIGGLPKPGSVIIYCLSEWCVYVFLFYINKNAHPHTGCLKKN